MTEDIAQDYEEYRAVMEEMHMHNVLSSASEYVNDYGIDRFLRLLQTYIDSPAQSMLTQRCIEWLENDYNTQLRNKKAAEWIRLNADEHEPQ